MRWTRILRVLCLALVFFSAQLIYAVFFAIRKYSEVQPAELTWHLQHPLEAFWTVISKFIYNPRSLFLLSITFAGMITWALLLGFATDLGLAFLKKHIPHKKLQAE